MNTISTQTVLQNLAIEKLNEMQEAANKAIHEQKEVLLLSATGSGKTLAYLLPVLQMLDRDNKNVQALIIVPSRELAIQIDDVMRKMGTGYKVTLCYGGHKRETEENNLTQAPAVIIGTAGRLADHLRRNNFSTEQISTLVLDEFDKSLELGFHEEMAFILSSLPNVKKKILTSATDAAVIPDFVGITELFRVDFLTHADKLDLDVKWILSDDKDKVNTLFRLICFIGSKPTIVFCNHRESVERTSEMLKDKGIINEFYHGGMEQQERDSALCKFRNGTVTVLVTTDLASRGLDIPGIRFIIHYHLYYLLQST